MSIVARLSECGKRSVVLLLIAASAGCAHWDCSRVTGDASLRIGRLSGGDGPRVNIIEVFSTGEIRFQLLGRRSYCGRVSAEEAREILALADPKQIDSLRDTPLGFDEPEAQVERNGVRIRVPLKQPPPALVPLFRRVDATFGAAFGARYDPPLLAVANPREVPPSS
jgi:hypothetical protein